MAFLRGNTIPDRRKHLQQMVADRQFEVKEHQINGEVNRLSGEIYRLQERVRQLEQQLDSITSKLGNPQFQAQWQQLEQAKIKTEQELERLTNIEIQEARELERDLINFSSMVRNEEKFDKSLA